MILFLTSNIGGIQKKNGEKIATPFSNDNNFLTNLKKYVKDYHKFVLIASDPVNYSKNDEYMRLDKESLELSGMSFEEYYILDNRNKDSIKEIIGNSSLIILSGGNTYEQNIFFNEINLKEYLKDISAVIVGLSAGAINSAKKVYNSPESNEDLKLPCYLNGLELTNINVEPHFMLDVDSENDKIQRNSVLNESFKRNIIALTDGAYIINDHENNVLYGESYIITKGKITKICDNNNSIELENL